MLGGGCRGWALRTPRRGWHTHTWIRFTRWQDSVKERETFTRYDELAKVHTDPTTGIFISIDDPSEVIKKPYEDRTREEVGGFKLDTIAYNTEWRYLDTTFASQKRIQRYLGFVLAQYDQRFLPERHIALGPDLAAAHFLVARGASVKFLGDPKWYKADGKGNFGLPDTRVPGLFLEAIDASGTQLRYEGLENLLDLHHLRLLSLAHCPHVTDWCLDRLAGQLGPSLEFLDLDGCDRLTAQGLSGLAPLKGLRLLRLGPGKGRPPSTYDPAALGQAALRLEAAVPGLDVIGVDYKDAAEELRRKMQLLAQPNVFEDARGAAYLVDSDGESYHVGGGGIGERPVVDEDDLPLLRSQVCKDPPNLPLHELEHIDQLSQGRLRHSLVGNPSGLERAEETERLLAFEAKKADKFNRPVHPFLLPKETRERRRDAIPIESAEAQPLLHSAAKNP